MTIKSGQGVFYLVGDSLPPTVKKEATLPNRETATVRHVAGESRRRAGKGPHQKGSTL